MEFLESEKDLIEKKNASKSFDRSINIQCNELEYEKKQKQKQEAMLIKETKLRREEILAHELKQLKDNDLVEQQKR